MSPVRGGGKAGTVDAFEKGVQPHSPSQLAKTIQRMVEREPVRWVRRRTGPGYLIANDLELAHGGAESAIRTRFVAGAVVLKKYEPDVCLVAAALWWAAFS